MATQKEKIDALTAELAEEKKATKRARTERDKYKAQLAERGDKIGSFKGHVLLTTSQKLDKGWRRASEVRTGPHALHYEDGSIEIYDDAGTAQQVQRHNAYTKKKSASTLHSTGSSTYICTFPKGCTEEDFGTLIGGDFTAYVAKDKNGKVNSITLVSD